MTIAAFSFDAAYGLPVVCQWYASHVIFARFIVPQFNSTGQATSPVKTADGAPAMIRFTAIKIDQIGRAKQLK